MEKTILEEVRELETSNKKTKRSLRNKKFGMYLAVSVVLIWLVYWLF